MSKIRRLEVVMDELCADIRKATYRLHLIGHPKMLSLLSHVGRPSHPIAIISDTP